MDNKERSALLVMDMIPAILQRLDGQALKDLLQNVKTAISAARSAGIPIIYIALGFRKGFPDVSPQSKAFAQLRTAGNPAFEGPVLIHPDLNRQPEDLIVVKKRFSAFTGSDLELVLRSGDIRHLVLTGISTSGVVLSTLREAADKDFHLSVLSDACTDADPEVHRVLITKIFPRQADVQTAAEWAAAING